MSRQAVLVVGSSGNVGVSVIIAALRSDLDAIAVVRNDASKEKVLGHLKTSENLDVDRVTFVEADVLSENGVAQVVDQVKSGKLPDFQHVYVAVGTWQEKSPIWTLDIPTFRSVMSIALDSTFFAYRATMPYLVEKKHPDSTWTLVTGAAGEYGFPPITAVSQGALFSFANVASRENKDTNVRFNEVYLDYRVDYDAICDKEPMMPDGKTKRMKSSEFARVYEKILSDKNIDASRIIVESFEDVEKLKIEPKDINKRIMGT